MKVCLLLCMSAAWLAALGQTKKDPLVTLLDHRKKPVPENAAFSYYETLWKEDSLYRAQLVVYPENKVVADYFYATNERKQYHGRYLSYHSNGRMNDSMHYVYGKKQGLHFGWHDDGSIRMQYRYVNDMPFDTCLTWDKEGYVRSLLVADSNGNGFEQTMYDNGKVKEIGRLKDGLRYGPWKVKNEEGQIVMELQYLADSLVETRCLDSLGVTIAGDCIYEKVPSFPGGLKGWSKFLELNLRYPHDALSMQVQGVVKVKFVVQKDGSISDLEILSSPHKSMSAEVLRLMKKSPSWVPAIQLNKPVNYRHIQSVAFKLQ
jgi:TonB family protein